MIKLRRLVPILGVFSLVALFLKLPEVPNFFGLFACKTCSAGNPYLVLIAAGYFAALAAIALLFPSFPGPLVVRGGLIWSVLLAGALTYVKYPTWCFICLFCHACHIAIWGIWRVVPNGLPRAAFFRERLCLMLFGPISVVALFSCLNLTFMVYGHKKSSVSTSLRHGDTVPTFTAKTLEGSIISSKDSAWGIVLNFVSPDCPFCKEQLLVLDAVATELVSSSYRIINVSPKLQPELIRYSPATEWVEDKESNLQRLFKVFGFPTMVVVGNDGKIDQVVPGVSEKLKTYLLTNLVEPKKS
jgi:thiol-disulfide isomerase/thioredoxin